MADLDSIFQDVGTKYGIDPLLLKAQATYESKLDPNFQNPDSSASGISAFTDATAKDYNVDRSDPLSSIDGQARYLKNNLQKTKGDPVAALSMYKTGPNSQNIDDDYVKNITDIYQGLKKNQGSRMAQDTTAQLEPQDDFERELLGTSAPDNGQQIQPQDDFERELLASSPDVASSPKDSFEKEITTVVPKSKKELEQAIRDEDYSNALTNARQSMAGSQDKSTLSNILSSVAGPYVANKVMGTYGNQMGGVLPSEVGYAANAENQIPGLHELGSAEVAGYNALTGNKNFGDEFNRLELAQQAMRQAGQEHDPGATTLGEVGAGLAGAGLVPRIGPEATSAIGNIGSGVLNGSLYGAAYGAGQGGDARLSDEDSAAGRLSQSTNTGLTSGFLGGAFPAAIGAGRGIANVFSGSDISPEIANLAKAASAKGINIPGGLLSTNPNINRAYSMLNRLGLTGKDDNVSNFTRDVSNTFGEDTSKLTRQAMSKAEDNIGDMFDEVRDATKEIKLDNPLLTKLGDAESMANQLLPDSDKRIKNQITDILNVAAKNNGAIPIKNWQNLVGSKSALTALSKSGLDPASGPAHDIKSALYDALGDNAPADMQDKFAQANKFYKNFKTVQQKGLDPVTGEFSPTALASNVTRTSKKYGEKGIEDLQELGDIGRQFNLTPSSHTAENYLLSKGLLGGAGLVDSGLAFHSPLLAAKLAGAQAATVGAGRSLGSALSSNWYRNRLINSALNNNGPSALSQFTNGTNYIPALAYGTNKLLSGQ